MHVSLVIAKRSAILAIAIAALCTPKAQAAPLAAAPAIVESFDVGTLHVDRYGTGTKALLLVPGLGCGPWEWYGTISHFSNAYDIYAITLPGFDGRPATNETALFAAFVRDAARLIAERKLDRPIVAGHSIGGTLALAFGEQRPALPGAIVSVDGLPIFPPLAMTPADARVAMADRAVAALTNISHDDYVKYEARYMATIGTADPALVDPTAVLEGKSDPQAVGAWMHEDLVSDFRPGLAAITAPVLEIVPYNAADRTEPPANYTQEQTMEFYRSLLAGTPHLTVTAIPNARHFAMLDQPDAFYAALGAFLSANATS